MTNRYRPAKILMDENLIYHAKMLETAGTTIFDRISKTNGTMTNMEGDEHLNFGQLGGLNLDGVDEDVATGRVGILDNITDFTFACHFKLNALPANNQSIMTIYTSGTDRIILIRWRQSDGMIRVTRYDGTALHTNSPTLLSVSQLYSLVVVSTAAKCQIYLDNVLDVDNTQTFAGDTSTGQMKIGSRNNDHYLNGEIYDPRLYLGEVSPAFIAAHNAQRLAALAA